MVRWTGVIVVAALVVAGYANAVAQRRTERGAPSFRDRVELTSRARVEEYIRTVRFDTMSGAGDWRRVRWPGSVGTIVEVLPAVGANRLTPAQLQRGRIIARVRTSAEVRSLGLPRGVSYVWMDSTGSTWRWVIIPGDPRIPLRQLPARFEPHRRLGAACDQIGARVVEYDSLQAEVGGWIWVQCGCLACCCIRGQGCIPKPWFGDGAPPAGGHPVVQPVDTLRLVP